MTLGARLEELIGHDAGGRGLARHADNLLTRSRGHLQGAATLLATAGETRPLIVTGFPILAADPPGTGETDGPPGALALARASVAAGGKAVLAAAGIVTPDAPRRRASWRISTRSRDPTPPRRSSASTATFVTCASSSTYIIPA